MAHITPPPIEFHTECFRGIPLRAFSINYLHVRDSLIGFHVIVQLKIKLPTGVRDGLRWTRRPFLVRQSFVTRFAAATVTLARLGPQRGAYEMREKRVTS